MKMRIDTVEVKGTGSTRSVPPWVLAATLLTACVMRLWMSNGLI